MTLAICALLVAWFFLLEAYRTAPVRASAYVARFSLTVGEVAVGPMVAGLTHVSASHLLKNIAVLATFGWKFERYENRYRYLAFFLLVTYVSIRAEGLMLMYLTQMRAVTVGASGSVLAIATSATIRSWPARHTLREWGDSPLHDLVTAVTETPAVLLLVVGAVAITATVLGDFLVPTENTAKYTHLTGVLVGGVHGTYALARDW